MKLKIFMATGIILVTGLIVFAGCRHHRFCKGFPPERVADLVNSKIDTIVDVLTLTEDQQKQFKNLRDRIKSDFIKMRDDRLMVMDDVKEKLDAENPDLDKVVEYIKGKIKNKPNHIELGLDYFTEFYNILNKEQKEIVIQKIREGIDKKMERIDRLGQILDKIDR